MRKKFILWLCKILKVDLVEPIDQILTVNYIHEKLPYTLIQDQLKISERDFKQYAPTQDLKLRIHQRLLAKIEPLIEWECFTDPLTQEINVRTQIFVASPKNS
jgi:hypothetical protein